MLPNSKGSQDARSSVSSATSLVRSQLKKSLLAKMSRAADGAHPLRSSGQGDGSLLGAPQVKGALVNCSNGRNGYGSDPPRTMSQQEGGTREGGGDDEEDEEDVCVLTLCDDGLVVDEEYQRQKRRERDMKRKRRERERKALQQSVFAGTQDRRKGEQVRAAPAEQDKFDRSFPQQALGIPALFNQQQQPLGLSSTRAEGQGEGGFSARSHTGPVELGWKAGGFHVRGGNGNGIAAWAERDPGAVSQTAEGKESVDSTHVSALGSGDQYDKSSGGWTSLQSRGRDGFLGGVSRPSVNGSTADEGRSLWSYQPLKLGNGLSAGGDHGNSQGFNKQAPLASVLGSSSALSSVESRSPVASAGKVCCVC